MRETVRAKLAGFVAAAAVGLSVATDANQVSAPRPPTDVDVAPLIDAQSPASLAAFEGVWDYNHLESVNIVTGRPEQTPRSATTGTAGRAGVVPGRSGAGATGGGRGAGGFGAGGGDFGAARPSGAFSLAPSPEMLREQRDMSRDLLEVPEQYVIRVADATMTFIDDIDRARSYPVDGRKRKYRLGASEFSARMQWKGAELWKDIEGPLGFRMTEVYFLSPDAQRLFVMIRVGQAGRNRQQSGFNRVYDRLDAPAASSVAVRH